MKWVEGIFGILIAIVAFCWGGLMASSDPFWGGDSPEFGIPIMSIGVALLIFTPFMARRLAAIQTFVIIIGVVSLVVGLSWIEEARDNYQWPVWPGFIFIVAGVVLMLFHIKIPGSILRAGKYIWATKYRRAITMVTTSVVVVALVILIQYRQTFSVLHYDGSTWIPMSSGTTVDLHGVWGSSSSDVFAVGNYGTIVHYNGNTWSKMHSGTKNRLSSIWGSSPSDVLAVEYYSGTILHYDSNTWSTMSSGSADRISGVWGSFPSDIFAVGSGATRASNGNIVDINGIILHYDGGTWSKIISGTTVDLHGVWGSSHSDVFAVGN